jgi:hypothetical protein
MDYLGKWAGFYEKSIDTNFRQGTGLDRRRDNPSRDVLGAFTAEHAAAATYAVQDIF